MILVHHQWDVGIGFAGGLDQVLDEVFARVLACARAGLQDDGCAHLIGSGHHGLHLLQVVDVEGRNAVAVDRCVVKQFAHGNECHEYPLVSW